MSENKINILSLQKYKSKIEIGNLSIFNTRRFNRFQRLMYKVFFGATVINLEEVENE